MKCNCSNGDLYVIKFKFVDTAILNFENVLPFLHYWTNRLKTWKECWESYTEHNCDIEIAYLPKFKMVATTFLNSENRLQSSLLDWSLPTLNNENLPWNDTVSLNVHMNQTSRRWTAPSWISRIGCYSITTVTIIFHSDKNDEKLP